MPYVGDNKKRLLFITSGPQMLTGGEQYLAKFIKTTAEEGYVIRIISLDDFGKRIGWVIFDRVKNILISLSCCWFIRGKYDVIIDNHSQGRKTILFKLYQKIFHKVKLVSLVMHFDDYIDDKPNRMIDKIYEKLYFLIADKIVVVSKYIEKITIRMGAKKEKVVIIYPAEIIKNVDAKKQKKKDGVVHLLSVGHIYARKGVLKLIDVITLMRDESIILHLIGDTIKSQLYTAAVKRKINDLNLFTKIHIHGRVNDAELAEHYKKADIFVMPSLKEGFGIVLLEAMHFKLPIVANNLEVFRELVIHGKNGYLCDIHDPKCFAKYIKKLIDNSKMRKTMGQWGNRYVLPKYSWEESQNKFRLLINKIQ
jgi:glycosyltransferase involved in cell wall biosynthesis